MKSNEFIPYKKSINLNIKKNGNICLVFFLYHLKSVTNYTSIFILTFSLSQLYPKTIFSIIKIVVGVIKKKLIIFVCYIVCIIEINNHD